MSSARNPLGQVIQIPYLPTQISLPIDNQPESTLELESDDEIGIPLNEHLHQHKMNMTAVLPTWEITTTDKQTENRIPIKFINRPLASQLHHHFLNPYIYQCIRPIHSLDELVGLLGVLDDWIEHYNSVKNNNLVKRCLEIFKRLPESTSEANIENCLATFFEILYQELCGSIMQHLSGIYFIIGSVTYTS